MIEILMHEIAKTTVEFLEKYGKTAEEREEICRNFVYLFNEITAGRWN